MLLSTEAGRTGHRIDAGQDLAAQARRLVEAGPEGPGVRRAVIVTLGAAGVLVLERKVVPPAVPATAAAAADGENPCEPAEPAAVAAPRTEPPIARSADSIAVWEVAAERVTPVDSTGAGDAFNGALAAAIAEGRPLAEAVDRAVVAGALATRHVGAREGMPTAAELEEYLTTR